MAAKVLGGGSGAVAASSHAACARFCGTDPLITGVTRRGLAAALGKADHHGGIPDARWMRAMTFERLVRDARFASQVATTAVGRLGLARPTSVVIANARVDRSRTAECLQAAHDRAVSDGAATMIHALALPFVGFEHETATDVRPDFAVVAPQVPDVDGQVAASWLVMGDAKDYERVRSRIDDARLLKGFLQVALGAESAAKWSQMPVGMAVHGYGVLAVPRNAFLQPEALVEDLADHREEVVMRVLERQREAAAAGVDPSLPLADHVAHLRATFDPARCTSCTLFSYCRHELRSSIDPHDLLVEIGVPVGERAAVLDLVGTAGTGTRGSASTRARVTATVTGAGTRTGQARIDPVGEPGTIDVVIAKSDSAALGIYGLAVRRVSRSGTGTWQVTVFDDPQSSTTRRSVAAVLGREIVAAGQDREAADPGAPQPVHLVVPDPVTADVIASIADNLAGIELSRLRWQRDLAVGRTPLTFDGEEAQLPDELSPDARVGVSFLLEEDRARAFTLRSPVVDLRTVLARHVVAGGPAVNAFRLDYLLPWAEPANVDHRALADQVEDEDHTPGARLTNRRSNAIHAALVGERVRGGSRRPVRRPADPAAYEALVRDELEYKSQLLDRAVTALASYPASRLRDAYRAIEGDAQAVWRRRLELRSSDLVRFGRTYRYWRNALVQVIEADGKCAKQLLVLTNPQAALDAARDAGTRQVATARVVGVAPIVLEVDSRRIGATQRLVLLHVNNASCVESGAVKVTPQVTAFKIVGLSAGPLADGPSGSGHLVWTPAVDPDLVVGDELVVADVTWFSDLKSNTQVNVARPTPDRTNAPKAECTASTHALDADEHKYCCRPHEVAEADTSDYLAGRRERGELNPEVWPPVVDADAFEVTAAGAPIGDASSEPVVSAPDDVTLDDLE